MYGTRRFQMMLECLTMGRLRSGGIGVSKQHGNWNIIVQTLLCWIGWLGGWTFVDFSVPWDKNVVSKEDEKINNYCPSIKAITKLHRVSAKVVPLVVGCLGVVSCRLEQYLKELGIPDVLGRMQTSAVVGTTQILQKILGL